MDDQFQDNQVDPWDQANQNDPWDQPSQPQDQSSQSDSWNQPSQPENSGYQNQQPVPQQPVQQQPAPQQPVNQYSYQQQVPPRPATYPGKGLSVASMVLGILALVFLFTGWFSIIAVIMGIVGLALGISGKKKTPNGMATAGIVLSIIALALGALIFVSCVVCTACIVNSAVDYGPGWSDIFRDAENWDYTL